MSARNMAELEHRVCLSAYVGFNLVGVHVPEHALLQNHAWAEA